MSSTNIPLHEHIKPIFNLKIIFKTLRIHQWIKNLLVFIPLLTAYKLTDLHVLQSALKGFFAFSLCASSAYIINDLFDLSADRQHIHKKLRPFAAGDISIQAGLCSIPLLLLCSFTLASSISTQFAIILGIYFLMTCCYSFYFKKVSLLDVIILAMLYVMRIISGGVATQIPLSEWLMVFSLFLFLSLAFMKRASEIHYLRNQNRLVVAGRGYLASDLEQIISFGTSSGYIAVLVFALYIHSETIMQLYRYPQILWLFCPILLYWISRAWLLAQRGQMHEDPIIFAVKDKTSYLLGIFMLIILCFAK